MFQFIRVPHQKWLLKEALENDLRTAMAYNIFGELGDDLENALREICHRTRKRVARSIT